MLRIVREGEQAPQNLQLREALDRVTRGSASLIGFSILEVYEAEALYRVLASRQFTQAQLDAWVERLRADHPNDRTRRGSKSPSLWAIVRWVFMGGDKPWDDAPVESITDWIKRTRRWIQEQIVAIDQPTWLELPLQSLDRVRDEITLEIGEAQWAMPVLRWALVQLLTSPADAATTSDTSATG